jgi:two-component system, LytTR family, sensor kinase
MLTDWDVRTIVAITDTLFSNVALGAACILIANMIRFYRPRYLYLVIWCVALAGLWAGIVRFGLGFIFRNEPTYISFLEQSMAIRFDFAFLVTGCVALMSMLWFSLDEQKQYQERKANAEKLAKEAELYKLRQQLQPHFLFNSLNSISALAGNQPQLARKMIQQLSDFLRGTLKKEEFMWVSLEEELQHLELYLEIEKVRFGNRLSTSVSMEPAAAKLQLPPMILQPIVENAIKFGLYDTIDSITIKIEAVQSDSMLMIRVENPFDPETSVPEGTGFGLKSLERRLYLLFARNDLLSTEVKGNHFITIVKIPQHDQSSVNR